MIKANDLIGPWRLDRRLGAGGMGSVWKATPSAGGPAVALKLLLEPSSAAVHRFFDEAKRGRAITHPNVVRIFDSGKDGEHVWMSMELLHGRTLSSLLSARGPAWPIGLVCALSAQGLAGLEAVHQHFVHRDVKPSNLVLTSEGVLKLIDFGIAAGDEVERTQTKTGTMRGSLPYTPPEQARGEAVDERGDLFSFGLVMHELLTGKRVFDQTNDAAIVTALMLHPIPAPEVLRPEVPPALSALVMKALERDRDKRPQTARALASALADVSAQIEARWTPAQIARWLAAQPAPNASVANVTASLEPAAPMVVNPAPRSAAPPAPVRRRWVLPAASLVTVALGAGTMLLGSRVLSAAERAAGDGATTPEVRSVGADAGAAPVVFVEPEPSRDEVRDAGPTVDVAVAEPPKPTAAPRTTKSTAVRPRGFVTIDARPTYGHVSIDGKPAGVTPLARLPLGEGKHLVEVARDDGTVRRKTLRVSSGQEVRWVVTW